MHYLEGLKYETELYINMGYYTIRLYPAIQDMTMIVTEFGKFIDNFSPMDMCTLGYIFQAIRFITDYHRLNRKLVRKLYTLLIIC